MSRLLFPVPLLLQIGLLGAVLLIWRRTRRTGVALLLCSHVLLAVFSLPLFSDSLLKRLERTHPPLTEARLQTWLSETAPTDLLIIGVAGSGFYAHETLDATSAEAPGAPATHDLWAGFNDDFLVRLQEAGRIAQRLEMEGRDYRLAVSICSSVAIETKVAALEQYFSRFGTPPERLVLIDNAVNSKAEIACFGALDGKLILVSSAFHMARLMKLAEARSVSAMPAPAGYIACNPLYLIPSADALNNFRIVVYECLGSLEAWKP
ncbi:MAG TPA: ElyC/SanA/YdcF family protein [Lentisphaeria bacterium]|nr:ElyC/SanA/YdcF family protein [Lentisphaeria bacterium]